MFFFYFLKNDIYTRGRIKRWEGKYRWYKSPVNLQKKYGTSNKQARDRPWGVAFGAAATETICPPRLRCVSVVLFWHKRWCDVAPQSILTAYECVTI